MKTALCKKETKNKNNPFFINFSYFLYKTDANFTQSKDN